jgi:altronate hydrolase
MSQRALIIVLHPSDDVGISRRQILGGTQVDGVQVRGIIPAGHKVALRDRAVGEPVHRYNQIIGFATRAIAAGEHVHTHNLGMGNFDREYALGADAKPAPARRQAQFMGIRRANGAVATRNYIGILSSVNCSATVARAIADHFARSRADSPLHGFPQVDGVVALTHGTGCAMDSDGLGMQVLQRTLHGYCVHPNFAAVLIIGLGCESNQLSALLSSGGLAHSAQFQSFNIQDTGGTAQSVAQGIDIVGEFLPQANAVGRVSCGAEHLTVGLQCGGSDGYSGISANPALGFASDLLVAHGGTVILSETPEIYGAEHLLTRRAAQSVIGEQLLERIRWWEAYVKSHNGTLDNNPSHGNKVGGLTTILEKSLGAIAKGGTTNLQAVVEYAQPITTHGLVFMDTPGYDPVSATGQVAGGANLICFTTGRGSAYGCAPAPSLKLSTNTALWHRQQEDIDINCGNIIDGDSTVAEMGARIFACFLKTASGHKTKSEIHGYGQNEFVPWQLGATM